MVTEIKVSDKINVSLDTSETEPSFITIEDNGGHVFIDVSEWDSAKQAVDKLIFEQKGVDIDNMTDSQKQARREQLLSWLDEIK